MYALWSKDSHFFLTGHPPIVYDTVCTIKIVLTKLPGSNNTINLNDQEMRFHHAIVCDAKNEITIQKKKNVCAQKMA